MHADLLSSLPLIMLSHLFSANHMQQLVVLLAFSLQVFIPLKIA